MTRKELNTNFHELDELTRIFYPFSGSLFRVIRVIRGQKISFFYS
jgi:hypothetical protein